MLINPGEYLKLPITDIKMQNSIPVLGNRGLSLGILALFTISCDQLLLCQDVGASTNPAQSLSADAFARSGMMIIDADQSRAQPLVLRAAPTDYKSAYEFAIDKLKDKSFEGAEKMFAEGVGEWAGRGFVTILKSGTGNFAASDLIPSLSMLRSLSGQSAITSPAATSATVRVLGALSRFLRGDFVSSFFYSEPLDWIDGMSMEDYYNNEEARRRQIEIALELYGANDARLSAEIAQMAADERRKLEMQKEQEEKENQKSVGPPTPAVPSQDPSSNCIQHLNCYTPTVPPPIYIPPPPPPTVWTLPPYSPFLPVNSSGGSGGCGDECGGSGPPSVVPLPVPP